MHRSVSHVSTFLIVATITVLVEGFSAGDPHKRSFASLGCLGEYDTAVFARLDRICEDCYQVYRDNELYKLCRKDCFNNDDFVKCVDALLLNHEQEKFQQMVQLLYGKK